MPLKMGRPGWSRVFQCTGAVLALVVWNRMPQAAQNSGSATRTTKSRAEPSSAPRDSAAPGPPSDVDRDDIPDRLERDLAEKFAPVLFYDRDDPNHPTNVRMFLAKTELWFYDDRCDLRHDRITKLIGPTIPAFRYPPCAATDAYFYSEGTRSTGKRRTFYLADVNPDERKGSLEPNAWTIYFHAYLNDIGGITVQYWQLYPYNTGQLLGRAVALGSHGGDWEAIHVVLAPGPEYRPQEVRFLGHRSISSRPWSELVTFDTHPLVRVEKGGHTNTPGSKELLKPNPNYIRHETWTTVRRPETAGIPDKPLVNLGEKTAPMKGMEFIQYSGLWGSRQDGFLGAYRSGYWGPAYNETGMRPDGFITAWCEGMKNPGKEIPADGPSIRLRECYPSAISR